MKIFTMTEPSMVPAACAPAGARTARLPWLSQDHQVFSQAELAKVLVRTGETYGRNVSAVDRTQLGNKRPVQGARGGVPPRGRPV